MTAELSPQPLDAFLRSVASTTYEEARRLPGAAVASSRDFDEIQAYILDLYAGVDAVESYVETDGQVVDCIPEYAHPAARRWGGLAVAPDQGPPEPTESDEPMTPDTRPPDIRSRDAVSPPQHDVSAARAAPAGTTPLYRTTLSALCRFPNLAASSAKERPLDLAGTEAPAAALGKRYATGEQNLPCLGGASRINVWSPFAAASNQSTFSQQWYYAGLEGPVLQTVECGWHVDITLYGDAAPHFFVFTTRRNYEAGHSFYNQAGQVFQPVSNPYVRPGAPLAVSQSGGTQVEYKMGFYFTNNAWWLYFDDHAIGCYPAAWFENGPMATNATRAKFGGEVGTLITQWPPMGSGRHASAGFRQAAYQRVATVNPASGGAAHATLSDAGSVSGPCYSLQITNNSGPDWGSYLFFGGPGGDSC
ncbi:neprosin family prolyl endopeptidase [Streptomyces sp. NPDC047071]|uniref:neprosin family prolyl endopeptidase n=1 Tax=Streptomyces sp. NPDC047071 TaxID=3154808 RepID=UPI0034566BDA